MGREYNRIAEDLSNLARLPEKLLGLLYIRTRWGTPDTETTDMTDAEIVDPPVLNDELSVVRNELTSALHEAHYQRRKRADSVQLLAYERLVRRSRVAGTLWLLLALALAAGGVWAFSRSSEIADVWQIGAASAAALALVCITVAVITWAGPARAQQSLSLRQVKKLAPPEMLSEAWFQVAHEVTTPQGYRKAFHGLV